MAVICPSFLRGRVARFTRLDSCGRPVAGACGQVVTKGIISVEMSTEVEEGEETLVKDFSGTLCIADKACDQIKWYTVTITLCAVDIDLVTMINPSWRKLTAENGDVIGWVENTILDCSTGFAMELWVEAANVESVCDNPDAEGAWGYLVLPWLIGGVVGDLTIENGAVQFAFAGRSKTGSKWGVGPYNIRQNPLTSAPMPLPEVIQSTDPRAFLITTLSPPTPVCGCQTLTPIVPPMPVVTAVEDPTDETGNTATITWTNYGAGPMTLDFDDGVVPNVVVADTGSMTHTYVNAGAHIVSVTDVDQPLRTDNAPSITTPFP